MILCRDRAGAVHVFLNSCRHRGMKVCRYDDGNTPLFTCPYHGWSYATDGRLVGVPILQRGAITRSSTNRNGAWSRWPQLCCYKGTVWATWDPDAPPFLEYLGDFGRYLDLILDGWDGSEGGTGVLGGIHKWRIPCNWKFAAENFCGDTLPQHQPSLGRPGRHRPERQRTARHAGAARGPPPEVAFHERGHQPASTFFRKARPVPPSYQHSPDRRRIFRPLREERPPQAASAARLIGSAGEIFPNTSFHARQPRTIAVWHPRGTHQTEVWRWSSWTSDAPRGQGLPAPLLHALFRPGGHDRAGRHGELELRPPPAEGPSRAAIPTATSRASATRSRITSPRGCASPAR